MINENNKKAWCVNAEHAMSANNNGTTKICCMIDSVESTAIGNDTIDDNFNQQQFVDVREALQDGIQHQACNRCWHEEEGGRKSKRLRDNEKYIRHVEDGGKPFNGLAKFELNLGNTCNLKCRTCAPHSSSTWMKEYYEVYEKEAYGTFKNYAKEMKKYHQAYDVDSTFWPELIEALPNIRQFDFYGGEPFMSEKMWKTLEIAVEQGYAKDIELHYAVNGTLWPEDKVEIFKEFKHLNLNFSIDGHGEVFEYMRFPGKWSVTQANMEKAREFKKSHHDMHLSWCTTLSSINICHLPSLLDEFYRVYDGDFGIYLNLVHAPTEFSLSTLYPTVRPYVLDQLNTIPKEYTQIWEQYLPGIINFINSDGRGSEIDNEIVSVYRQFLKKIKTHDKYRDQDFAATFGEYHKQLNRTFIL